MKAIMRKYIIAASVILLTITSCKKDFLNLTPISNISATNFYKTESDFTQANIGVYAALQGVYGNTALPGYGAWIMGEMRSDNTVFIFNTKDGGQLGRADVDEFIDNTSQIATQSKYTSDYVIIGRANQVLKSLESVTFSDSSKNIFKGESLFLRALAYFDLVQYFGDVPLQLTPVTTYAETQTPRTAKATVYNQILADATTAAALLPAKSVQQAGRATSGAANMLLANVYMVTKDWAKAETLLKSIVSSGGYSLVSDYAQVFSPANKNNSESIFEVQYSDNASAGVYSVFAYLFLPTLADPGVIPGFPSSATNGSSGGWNTPTPDLIAAYETGDKRKEATIATVTVSNTTYPYLKKYVHGAAVFPITNDNWPVYRYSEVLLFLAEALNEQGKTGEAIPYITQVRARAGLTPITVTDQASVRLAIEHERQVEFAGENKRWLDLVRTDRAITVMNAQGVKVKANPAAYYYPQGIVPSPVSYNVQAFRLIFPIPNREISLNPKLTQNPGY